MNALWTYFWPALGFGLVLGILAGSITFRVRIVRSKDRPNEPTLVGQPRRKRVVLLTGGVAAAILGAALWHGPLGAADRFSGEVERSARQVLVDNDAPTGMTARIHHGPLTRQLVLSGPGNDFQRSEAARLLSQIPGVSGAVWTPTAGIPLIVEGAVAAVVGFLFGLLLAYLVELRRRYNAQWNW